MPRKRKKNNVQCKIPPSKVTKRKMTTEELADMDKSVLHGLKGIYGKYNLNDHYGKEKMLELKAKIEELESKNV